MSALFSFLHQTPGMSCMPCTCNSKFLTSDSSCHWSASHFTDLSISRLWWSMLVRQCGLTIRSLSAWKAWVCALDHMEKWCSASLLVSGIRTIVCPVIWGRWPARKQTQPRKERVSFAICRISHCNILSIFLEWGSTLHAEMCCKGNQLQARRVKSS